MRVSNELKGASPFNRVTVYSREPLHQRVERDERERERVEREHDALDEREQDEREREREREVPSLPVESTPTARSTARFYLAAPPGPPSSPSCTSPPWPRAW